MGKGKRIRQYMLRIIRFGGQQKYHQRGRYDFKGVILSDGEILEDCNSFCITGISDVQIEASVPPFPQPSGHLLDKTSARLVNFGSSNAAFLDVLSGKSKPEGKQPFDLPSSWNEALEQNSKKSGAS